MRIVVIGGTGLVGSKLVQQLKNAGHWVIAASRATGVDIVTGEGLSQTLRGADVVVDLSNPGYGEVASMHRFFKISTGQLLAAEHQARIRHHVVLSAIGVGHVSSGYYRAKSAQEAMITASMVPFTIVRSAPLFEYIYDLVDADRSAKIVRVPPISVQPIAGDDAARLLLDVAIRPPANEIIEISGPISYRLLDLAGQILTANEDDRSVMIDGNAPFFGTHLNGELPVGDRPGHIGATSFDNWLRRSLVPA